MTHCDPYPTYTRGERLADAAVHVLGLGLALVGAVMVIAWSVGHGDAATTTGLVVYGTALVGSFLASACYHFTPWEGPRPMLRRIDHAAIFLKIAGTYTPLVILIGSAFAYVVLGVVWTLAALGAGAKLFFWSRPGAGSTWLYLALGWISVALFSSLVPILSGGAIALLVAGGLVYTAGAVIFSIEGLRFQNAIWHGMVLTASGCFFAAIVWAALTQV